MVRCVANNACRQFINEPRLQGQEIDLHNYTLRINMASHTRFTDSTPTGRFGEDETALAERLFRLNDAGLRVTGTLETGNVLQEVADSACALTEARYGVLALFDPSEGLNEIVISGAGSHQLSRMATPPTDKGLVGYLNELDGPLRVANIADHPWSIGVPEDHPPIRSFLGAQVRHDGTHLGNIYLAKKLGDEEFTELDEEIITRFAAQAGAAISNSRRFERERRIKTDLRALVKIAPVGLLVFDARTGDVLTSNQECQRIGGEVGSQAMSWQETFENITMFRADGRQLPAGDRPSTQVLQSGEVVRAEEITLCFPDGRKINTLVSAAPIYSDQGDIVSVVVAMQDLTQLEDAERMRAEYLGMVSHELRTPLATIKGSIVALSELAQSLNDTEPLQLLQIIDHQAEVMRNQINSLIELSHIEAGTLSLSLEPIDPSTLIGDSVLEFKRNHAGFTVSQRVPVDSPRIMVDKERMSQALRDMFAHAVKYASAESTIFVSAEPEDFRVKISVSIANDRSNAAERPELLEWIRSAADEDAKQPYEGDGLVRTICKGIVEAHGGRFQAERGDCGRGITFTFTVPLAEGLSLNKSRRDDAQSTGAPTGYTFRSVAIDFDSHAVELNGQPIHLTATEYKLLCELSKNAGRVVTQDELLLEVWGSEYRGESQLLRAYVKTLRQKLGDNARSPSYIFTERGVGYRMAKG